MNPIKIIEKYYDKNSEEYRKLMKHSEAVMKKSVEIAKRIKPLLNIEFIKEAAMLHDIGVFLTYDPQSGYSGKEPYILHGILGREILEKEGLPKHALVCERHIGVGLTKEDVEKQNLPLPKKDMVPQTVEEEIVAYADLFFTKDDLNEVRTPEEIKKRLRRFGEEKVKKFEEWHQKFKA